MHTMTMEQRKQYWMWTRSRKLSAESPFPGTHIHMISTTSSYNNIGQSWEGRALPHQEYSAGHLLGDEYTWPPRSYNCSFCGREFRSAQALGGHMNIHRWDRARLRAHQDHHHHHHHNYKSCTAASVAAAGCGGGLLVASPLSPRVSEAAAAAAAATWPEVVAEKHSSSSVTQEMSRSQELIFHSITTSDQSFMDHDHSASAHRQLVSAPELKLGRDQKLKVTPIREVIFMASSKDHIRNEEEEEEAISIKRRRTDHNSVYFPSFFLRSTSSVCHERVLHKELEVPKLSSVHHPVEEEIDLELRLGGLQQNN